MSSGFTKTFRVIALVVLLCVMQVYVLAHPATTSITPATKNTESVNQPVVTDHQLNFIKQQQVTPQSQMASERSLILAPKSPLTLAFTKQSVEKHAAQTAFLKVKKGAYDPLLVKARPQDDEDDDDDDKKALIVTAVIVIAGVAAAAFFLSRDRDDDGIRGQ